jgi:hypothetical protein
MTRAAFHFASWCAFGVNQSHLCNRRGHSFAFRECCVVLTKRISQCLQGQCTVYEHLARGCRSNPWTERLPIRAYRTRLRSSQPYQAPDGRWENDFLSLFRLTGFSVPGQRFLNHVFHTQPFDPSSLYPSNRSNFGLLQPPTFWQKLHRMPFHGSSVHFFFPQIPRPPQSQMSETK